MSKYYIILTPGITNMGGSEMFTANKSQYLRKHGWNVSVFYFISDGKVLIPELKQYDGNCIPELIYNFTYCNKKLRNSIINKVICGINCCDEVVIESHLLGLGFWGEIIAKKVGGKNILCPLEENIPQVSVKEAAFLEWKMRRWEILNGSENSYKRIFNSLYKVEYNRYVHDYLRIQCSNVVSDASADLSAVLPSDFTILSVGRLDKPYILPAIKEVNSFVMLHADKIFNLLVVGGSPNGSVENAIDKICSNTKNLRVYHFGYLFPVPANIVRTADVAFSSSNSVLVSANQGVPTIAIDINDHQPLGVYGSTINNLFVRENEQYMSLAQWLDVVLFEQPFHKAIPDIQNDEREFEKAFDRQIEFLSKSVCDSNFYPVEHMYSKITYLINNVKFYIHKIINN